ncbi:MAG: tetratricopeptide repeat protein [Deltaproteobacteria bacterium]|jgi:predicted negative regulator of RcsB-dependent stress response|nr:tetratricopeptide repeat protein [Deltaproteobacteria bacterium]
MPKKVPIKKLLRTNDAFLTTSEKIYSYFLTNTKTIIIALSALIVVFIAILLVLHFRQARIDKAEAAFNRALAITDQTEAVAKLNEIRKSYSGSPADRQAAFAMAQIFLKNKQTDKALPLLEELAIELRPAEESLKPLIWVSLAGLYEDQNQLDKAAQAYKKALAAIKAGPEAPSGVPFKAYIHFSIGRVALALGKRFEAAEAFKEVLALESDSQISWEAQLKLAQLGPIEPPLAPGAAPNKAASPSEQTPKAQTSSNPPPSAIETDKGDDSQAHDHSAAPAAVTVDQGGEKK